MTLKQKVLRNQLLTRIHLNSTYKEIKANGAWGDFLLYRFGVESCASLSISELNLVLDILLSKDVPGEIRPDFIGRNLINNDNSDKAAKKDKSTTAKKITVSQLGYMKSLASRLDMSEGALVKFAAKQTKVLIRLVEQLEKLNMSDAKKVITGLEKLEKFYKKG